MSQNEPESQNNSSFTSRVTPDWEKKAGKGKSSLFSIIFCAISSLCLLIYFFKVDGPNSFKNILHPGYPIWIFRIIGCMIVYCILDGVILHMMVKSLYSQQTLRSSIRIAVIGQYFNCITPLATGGEPAQAFFLVSRKVPLGSAASALLAKFLIYQVTVTFYCLSMMILRLGFFMGNGSPFVVGVFIGFFINLIVTFLLLGAAFFEQGTIKISSMLIRFAGKIKILRNVEEKEEKIIEEVKNFHKQFQYLFKHKALLFKVLLLTILQLTFYFLIGFVIYKSFYLHEADVLTIVAAQTFILLVTSFVPIPGAFGAAEGGFYVFFERYFPNNLIAVALFMWRIVTFYLPVIVGMIFAMWERKRYYERIE